MVHPAVAPLLNGLDGVVFPSLEREHAYRRALERLSQDLTSVDFDYSLDLEDALLALTATYRPR